MRLTFLGAAGTVTGSKTLISTETTQVLIDCGAYQGNKHLRLRNWEKFPIDPKGIDGIVLTHAHVDHCGYIPRIIQEGYGNRVYCSAPTRDLAAILLPDAGRIHEEDAAYANRKGFSKHRPALPFFTESQGAAALGFFKACALDEEFRIGDLRFQFQRAGHILGACNVVVRDDRNSIIFSGDLGREHDFIECSPSPIPEVNYVVLESTYGNRHHERLDPLEYLRTMSLEAYDRQGIVLIPAFAVGRSQMLLYALGKLRLENRLPPMPIIMSSPMAAEVTEVYQRYPEWQRLKPSQWQQAMSMVRIVSSLEESKALNFLNGPAIIISASGMLTAGRILHYFKSYAGDPANKIFLPGFQAPGTRGAQLLQGSRIVKIHGAMIRVKAEVEHAPGFSAHADQNGLMRWLGTAPRSPKRIFLNHGEPEACEAIRQRIIDEWALPVTIPGYLETVDLETL